MRVKIDFYINKDMEFHKPLTEAMTAYIYRMLRDVDPKYASQLHERGYAQLGSKKFVYNSYDLSQNNTTIQRTVRKGPATLIFSSALEDTTINLVKGITRCGKIQLFGRSFEITGIQHIPDRPFKTSEAFKILSPVCALGTGYKWLNVKETEEKAANLLIEKYYALYGRLPNNPNIKLKILSPKTKYMNYKGMTIKGYTGVAILEGDKELIKLAYQSGLGIKCGIGMGLLERVE